MAALYIVDRPDDWKILARKMLKEAIQNPFASEGAYSKSETEMWDRIGAVLRDETALARTAQFAAGVLYKSKTFLSLVLTCGPNGVHLSVTIPEFPLRYRRLPDAIACEAAQAILGEYEEREEGPTTAIRHFYPRRHHGQSSTF